MTLCIIIYPKHLEAKYLELYIYANLTDSSTEKKLYTLTPVFQGGYDLNFLFTQMYFNWLN